jgi:hypothetical protein
MMPDEILVVFSDQTDLWWLKFLRRGFRHCFVMIRFADIWISVDALAHKTEIMRIDIPDTFGLIQWFESQGDYVVRYPVTPAEQKVLPPSVFSCVECVKRILGIRNIFIFTPWKLYQFLKSNTERNSDHG